MAIIYTQGGGVFNVEATRLEARDFLAVPDHQRPDSQWRTFELDGVDGRVTVRAEQVVAIKDDET